MKLCKDCKYYKESITVCSSTNNGISEIDGLPAAKFAIINRKYNELCGKDAAWFEPIPSSTQESWYKRMKNAIYRV